MSARSYKAYVVEETPDGGYRGHVRKKSTDDLPEGSVLVQVHYSSLNYKDALSATGKGCAQYNIPILS